MGQAVPLDAKRYGRLLTKVLPRPIRNDRECARMETALLALEDRTELSREEEELAELMAILIEKYEDEHHPVEGLSTPVDRLKALMEDRDVSQADLSRVIGSRSQASEILSGVRSISKAQAKTLAAHFRVPADMFI